MTRAVLLLAFVLLGSCATRPPETFSFALIGDLQYTPFEERVFPQLIDALNAENLAFVVHVGDFKSGSNSPCTDALFASRKADFERSRHPFVFLPGDNDWVDCRRDSNGRMDPLERLDALRKLFFATPESLGVRKMRLITNNPAKRAGLEAYGLEVVERVPIETVPNKHNVRYLDTKRRRMGHLLDGMDSLSGGV